jgi:uncharacterized protein YceK
MKKAVACFSVVLSVLLTGCASLPELTKEQDQMVTEYAAGLLLKYDAENHSRLVDTTAFMEEYNTALTAYEDAKNRYFDALREEEEKRIREMEAQKEANSQSTIIDLEEEGTSGEAADAPVVNYNASIAEYLGLSGISIEYGGMDLLDNYPEETDEFYMSMEATKGKKLLVVYFNVSNNSGSDMEVDIMHKKASFRFLINGELNVKKLETLLDDDLSTFEGTLSSGKNVRCVLVTEIPEDISVNSLNMTMKLDGMNAATKTLK